MRNLPSSRTFRSGLQCLIGFVAGFLLWHTSKWLTGRQEPWDAPFLYFPLMILLIALGTTLLQPNRPGGEESVSGSDSLCGFSPSGLPQASLLPSSGPFPCCASV